MAIDLSSLLNGGVILPLADASSRKQAILLLAEALAGKLGETVSAREIVDAVMEREQLGSTGVGDGVAIPHARLKQVSAPIGAYLRLKEGVDFDAIDERPCDIVFMLLAPLASGADHLRALAQVSRALRQSSIRDKLREVSTHEEVCAILCPTTSNVSAA
ncbi:MAG: PTS transporter subunit EIIA [Alphaproteobacteria bacterium]|jgi:PTS system nitrogen regulatory IIA component|nr:PTS transporter subunit EIIA [Alphaproteobacteria bacterium]